MAAVIHWKSLATRKCACISQMDAIDAMLSIGMLHGGEKIHPVRQYYETAAGCTVVQTHTLVSARLLLLLLPLVGGEWGDVKGRDAALELYFVTITRREGVASIPPLFFWSLSGTALIEFAPNWPPLPNTPPPPSHPRQTRAGEETHQWMRFNWGDKDAAFKG